MLLTMGLIFSISAQSQTVEASIQDIADDYGIMGMSLYINVDGTINETYIGLRDFDRNLPVNSHTQYRIASISKSVTALGVMKLVDSGLVELDDDISEALGYTVQNPNHPSTTITYRMLLSHTSSLQDGSGYGSFLTATYNQTPIPSINEVLNPSGAYYTPNMWRQEIPGTYFAYSNINYGLLGTLIEAISGQRFDLFMKAEILEPLSIEGSFNIQDLQDINDLSVLYRFNNGWEPQWDNFEGVMPTPPDLSTYIPGTNGAYFGPQGGLRTTASEVNMLTTALATNDEANLLNMSEATFSQMKSIQWDFNGSNGDNYFGLFNRWGLGLHHANTTTLDQICDGIETSFIGHPGEAYGLVSDTYFMEDNAGSFSLLINGVEAGYETGNSSYYTVEEDIFNVVCQFVSETLDNQDIALQNIEIYPNPTSKILHVRGISSTRDFQLINLMGTKVLKGTFAPASTSLNISSFASGIYFLEIAFETGTIIKKIVIE